MSYYPHGNYRLWLNGSTLYAELSGAWNTEAALAYEEDFIELAKKLSGSWGHIVYLDHWELCTPETAEVVERLVSWCVNHGLKRAANVYEPSQVKSAVLNKMIVSEEGNFKRAVFDNPKKAAEWLTAEGFPTEY